MRTAWRVREEASCRTVVKLLARQGEGRSAGAQEGAGEKTGTKTKGEDGGWDGGWDGMGWDGGEGVCVDGDEGEG